MNLRNLIMNLRNLIELRNLIKIGAMIITSLVVLYWLVSVIKLGLTESAWTEIAKEHFLAVVGMPAIACAAFVIVYTFEAVSGKIKFEIGPLKFEGSSGPIVMWVLVYSCISTLVLLAW